MAGPYRPRLHLGGAEEEAEPAHRRREGRGQGDGVSDGFVLSIVTWNCRSEPGCRRTKPEGGEIRFAKRAALVVGPLTNIIAWSQVVTRYDVKGGVYLC